ncbi:hypothetical protein [Parafannyhessea umbonata]|nr:hypothetical protein [Parafannyhessea umbonata]MDD7204638.1 hypothetical protein [Coriobacteriaceae bacterium]
MVDELREASTLFEQAIVPAAARMWQAVAVREFGLEAVATDGPANEG